MLTKIKIPLPDMMVSSHLLFIACELAVGFLNSYPFLVYGIAMGIPLLYGRM